MFTRLIEPESFATFGDLLKYLRRRERLTQLELSIEVGYSEGQISRLEKNQRLPDLTALKALFIPALRLEKEPQLAARLVELAQSSRQEDAPVPGIAPYKGMLFFDEADAEWFFGREALAAQLLARVNALAQIRLPRLFAIVGASGSGKSSVVRAGLAVALKRAGWDVRILTPTAHPLKMLDAQLALIGVNDARVLTIVDQFEEVFTLCRDDAVRGAFIQRLLTAASGSNGVQSVVIVLRADFYSHCSQYTELRQAIAARQEFIGQMTAEELRRAIEEPAKHGGWEIQPGLVDLMLRDVGAYGTEEQEPGALPLLSHALLATWERRRGRTFTLEGYRASGGVRGAIAETAESVFTDHLNQREQAIAHTVFVRLTKLGEGTDDTRRRAPQSELMPSADEAAQVRAVLNRLVEARLISVSEDSAEVAHEALIREWPRLREWLNQDREGLRLHRQLTEASQDWELFERDPGALYRGVRLAQAREFVQKNPNALNAQERTFLMTSVKNEKREAEEREEQQRREIAQAQKLATEQRERAEEQAQANAMLRTRERIAFVRELAANSNVNLEIDPERSILLALEAVAETYRVNQTVLPEAEEALHRAVGRSHLQRTLMGHSGSIYRIMFSPDGTQVATNSVDGTIRLWDLASGKVLIKISITPNWLGSLTFNPDGTSLATTDASRDERTTFARIWNTQSGQLVHTFDLEIAPLNWEFDTYTFDLERVAIGCKDGSTIIWDVATGKRLLTLLGHDRAVNALAFSPDSKYIVTASLDETAKVWDATTGNELLTLRGHASAIKDVVFDSTGTRIGTASADRTAKVWDATSGNEILTLAGHTDWVTAVAFSPDSTRIATTGWDAKVKVWDVMNGREILTLTGHTDRCIDVSFHPNGALLGSASKDITAKIWNLAPHQEHLTIRTGGISSLFWQLGTLTYSPDGEKLATGLRNGTTKMWDASSGDELMIFRGHTEAVNMIAYSQDGMQLASTSNDKTAKVWDTATGKELLSFHGHEQVVLSIAWSPDKARIATGSADKTVQVWDAVSGERFFTLQTESYEPFALAISSDGLLLAAATGSGTIFVWTLATGKSIFKINTKFPVYRIAFSPDSMRLAFISEDVPVKVVDARTGLQVLSVQGFTAPPRAISYSPDGTRIATGHLDGTAKLWDAVTGREMLTLYGDKSGIQSIAFSRDGKHLAVADVDTIRVYLLRIEDLVALAKTRLTRTWRKDECQKYLHVEECPAQK